MAPEDVDPAALRILSAGAVRAGLASVCALFEDRTGRKTVVRHATAPELEAQALSGAAFDIVLAPDATLSRLRAEGHVAGADVPVGRVGVGVAAAPGSRLPRLESCDDLRRLFLQSRSLVYNHASTGEHVDRLLRRWELRERLDARIVRCPTGAAVVRRLLEGAPGDVGFAAATELAVAAGASDLTHGGPLPPEAQSFTAYAAAAGAASACDPRVVAFLEFLDGEPAGHALAAAGLQRGA